MVNVIAVIVRNQNQVSLGQARKVTWLDRVDVNDLAAGFDEQTCVIHRSDLDVAPGGLERLHRSGLGMRGGRKGHEPKAQSDSQKQSHVLHESPQFAYFLFVFLVLCERSDANTRDFAGQSCRIGRRMAAACPSQKKEDTPAALGQGQRGQRKTHDSSREPLTRASEGSTNR